MGRSTPSCFKIISCASDSVDRDDLEASEGKGSSDKRGWSFRKKSTRHRVLSNTVILETPPSENKESPNSATVNYQAQANSTIPEETSGMQWADETPQLSTSVNSKLSEIIASTEDDTKFVVNPDESVIIVIQAAIRGFLAQRSLLKHKNVVKLQAAVRGHLTRRYAVGTLRCVQAIVKMQAIVRARRARLSIEGSNIEGKLDEKHGKDDRSLKLPGKQNSGTKQHLTYTSIEKLLSNNFARQLLESTPRTKSINIKCDPSRSDSAWKWLERWVSVSSKEVEQLHKPELSAELQEQEKVKHLENQVENVIPSAAYCKSDFQSEEKLVTCNTDDLDIQECQPTSSLAIHYLEQPQPDNRGMSNSKENSDLPPSQAKQSDCIRQMELNSPSGEPELETEQPETEGNQPVLGSRKASNPAFIAAQSKFEELTSTTNSAKSISSSNLDFGVESCAGTVPSAPDNAIRKREIDLAENSVPHSSRIQVGGSECGTELSISSTLDSPDRSEVGPVGFEPETKVLVEGTDNPACTENIDIEAKVEPTTPQTVVSFPISDQPEKEDNSNCADGEPFKSVIGGDSSKVEPKLEENASDVMIELEPETTGHQVYKSSPEASPRSHITVPESQGTPSSQVSAKAKKTRTDKNGSNKKRKSLSASKRSPITPNHDSGGRSSLEQLPKDHKTGSAGPDNVDQERRDSSSSNSLPSYMQATESARAKAQASSSPRSSPDVQDKDIYVKKRHSLPVSNGRQGSPRIQRSMSQAQQSAKGNGTHPHERKWQR